MRNDGQVLLRRRPQLRLSIRLRRSRRYCRERTAIPAITVKSPRSPATTSRAARALWLSDTAFAATRRHARRGGSPPCQVRVARGTSRKTTDGNSITCSPLNPIYQGRIRSGSKHATDRCLGPSKEVRSTFLLASFQYRFPDLATLSNRGLDDCFACNFRVILSAF